MSDPARPFLKWAGGKRQILDHLLALMPKSMGTYYEPFLGGGAVFFALAAKSCFQRAVLNDANHELVQCFQAVRAFPEDLIRQLSQWTVDQDTFEHIKALAPEELDPVHRAARTIYLNKTGFNGLFRVNKAGRFNVPFGKWKRVPTVFKADNLRACSEALNRHVSLYSRDFSAIMGEATAGDVVYLDPPYVPVSTTSNFRSYTRDGFTLDDQHRLAAAFRELATKGVTVIASNSDTEVVRSLYEGAKLYEIQAKRSINSKADRRGPVGELIIVG